ncbi:hypothetical protein [Leifsonia sp. Leaf264]|uniref:hypothetical protein n=1 Tax=Leifsonia sp. Leaf264 TaxID=1736314 RepID=UPI0006FA87AC|nr:hypothetical protein [Leifsonia sp. Leaf264]KQO98311.1 hypothetical protein ASF30_09635 [Leifsonia sp. Leaf264]
MTDRIVSRTITRLQLGETVPEADLLLAAVDVIRRRDETIAKLRAYIDPTAPELPVVDGWTDKIAALRARISSTDGAEILDQVAEYFAIDRDLIGFRAHIKPGPARTEEDIAPIVTGLRDLNLDGDAKALALNAADTIATLTAELARHRARDLEAEEARTAEFAKERVERKEWLAGRDERPSTYLGRKQPGADATYYGPDDVVVDGDWLESHERRATADAKKLTKIQKAVRDHRRTDEQKLDTIARTVGVFFD